MNHKAKIITAIVGIVVIVFAIFAYDIGREDNTTSTTNRTVDDMITVSMPQPNVVIESPLQMSGEARGMWFFEATFPINIHAADGIVLASGYAEAEDEWMTEEFVPWTASISFDPKGNTEGYVRFMKDNPSGLPEYDMHLDVPVKFRSGSTTAAALPK